MVAGFWRPGVSDDVYPTRRDAVAALVGIHRQDIADLIGAGVSWLQLDSLAYWANIDPEAARMRRVTDLEGHLSHIIDTDNGLIRSARSRRPGMTLAMHFCRGNMRSAWSARGGYEPIAERVFGEVEVDRFLLEYDTERSGGFEPLRFVPPAKTVVLGLVSSKVAELESVDTLPAHRRGVAVSAPGTARPQSAVRVRLDEPGQSADRRRPAPQAGTRRRDGTSGLGLTAEHRSGA